MLVLKIQNSRLLGLLTLTAAVMLIPTAGNASSYSDQDDQSSSATTSMVGRGGSSASSPYQLINWEAAHKNAKPKQANAPVPVFDDPIPDAPPKFQSRVQAHQVQPVPADDSSLPPPAPAKYQSLVNAGPAPLQPPQVPSKYQSRVSANQAPAPLVEPPVAQAPPPPTPTKYQSLVQASSVAPAPQPIVQPAPVIDQPAPAPVVDQPISPAPPPAPTKYSSRVQAQTIAPPPVVQPAPVSAPPAPTKYQSRVNTDPSAAPPVPTKMRNRVAADQVQTATPDAPAVTAPTAPLSQAAAPVTAATACPSPIATNGVTQATDLSKTLNQTLQVKPKQVVASNDDPLNWEDDDAIDSKDLAQLGTKEKAPQTDEKATGALTPFVKKLLTSAHIEANRYKRVIDGHVIEKKGSHRACLQGVRMAFEEAHGDPMVGWTNKAKDAGPFLKKYGYTKSPSGKYTAKNAPVGSVLIYDVPGHPSQAGHIEIKGTDGYYSDFYEKEPITSGPLGNRRRLIGVYVPPTT